MSALASSWLTLALRAPLAATAIYVGHALFVLAFAAHVLLVFASKDGDGATPIGADDAGAHGGACAEPTERTALAPRRARAPKAGAARTPQPYADACPPV